MNSRVQERLALYRAGKLGVWANLALSQRTELAALIAKDEGSYLKEAPVRSNVVAVAERRPVKESGLEKGKRFRSHSVGGRFG